MLGAPLVAQVTESPRTVVPGRVLMEMDGISLSYDRAPAAGNTHMAMAVATTIVSTGITRTLDVQVGFQAFIRQTFDLQGVRDSRSGFGDVIVRTKWTFWQDDRWGAAAAIMPYVKVPTNTGHVGNDEVEGGLIVPWSMALGGSARAGAMLKWDVLRNAAREGYDSRWNVSGFSQFDLNESSALYAEATFAAVSGGFSEWKGGLGLGVMWNLTDRVQVDMEWTKGLNRRTADWINVIRLNWGF